MRQRRKKIALSMVVMSAAAGSALLQPQEAFAYPAFSAPENRFLAHLLAPQMAHPPLLPGALVDMGWQACAAIRQGVSPDYERDYLQMKLMNQGVAAATADVGTLVHYALRDLCPDAPNSTGI